MRDGGEIEQSKMKRKSGGEREDMERSGGGRQRAGKKGCGRVEPAA